MTIAEDENIPLERIASVFSEKAAEIYGLERGKIQEGWYADLVIFDLNRQFVVRNEEQVGKCRWTPYDSAILDGVIEEVIINGKTLNL